MQYIYKAHVVRIYDADTITVDIDLGFHLTQHKLTIRLAGIDAPELRGTERVEGLRSRDALRSKILGKDVVVQTFKDRKEKYGRYLGLVIVDGENVNDWLVAEGYAVVSQ